MTIRTKLLAGVMIAAGAAWLAPTAAVAQSKEVEVVHWWTSGGEAAGLSVLRKAVEAKGITWKDAPISGGGGAQAMTVLQARLAAKNPPTATQGLGFDIQDFAAEGVLANLNGVADKEGWDKVIPAALQRFSKYKGQWVAAPVNVHSTNWVWANKAVLEKAGVTAMPANFDEFVAALDKVKAAGLIPLAHGGQPWQDATIFDSILLSVGNDFYKKSMIDLDPAALGSADMKTAFERMAKLRTYVDANFPGREWNLASAMVIKGDAAFQIMGDWAKGEFLAAGKVPGKDFVCFRFPGTQGTVTFNADQFAMFKVGADKQEAQAVLASSILDPAFQSAFNVKKGSVPARTDVSDKDFDDCGKKGMKDLAEASAKGTLFGSMAHGHASPAAVKNAIYDVVTRHFNGQLDTAKAVAELPKAVAAAK
ncbi:ABC transporter substrate-binding protein [Prosthecomicrobium sp. N25]|uniref:ABC transporter substrate-binding protein n=1 Tax=Prosthecomicrobium sp. N25 TaxID=3129254 RepID=UPI003FCCF052